MGIERLIEEVEETAAEVYKILELATRKVLRRSHEVELRKRNLFFRKGLLPKTGPIRRVLQRSQA